MNQQAHTLLNKIRIISRTKYTHIELGWSDLEAYVKSAGLAGSDEERLVKAAKDVRTLCNDLEIGILAVHTLSRFEGYTDPAKRGMNFERARLWFHVLSTLECDLLQVGSSDDPASSPDLDVIVRDFQELADLAAEQDPPISIAYENWAWGVHVNTWEQTWEICKRVDRPNFGLCLDTFQICARTYVSPTSPPHLYDPSAPFEKFSQSMNNLINTVSPEKIFYLQISDGSNKISSHELAQRAKAQSIHPLYAWSKAWRPLPFMDKIPVNSEEKVDYGGFLPVAEVVRAVLATGWDGPWSYEVFYEEDMSRPEPGITLKWVRAGMASHDKMLEEL